MTVIGAGFTQVASPVVLFGTTPATRVEFVDLAHLRVVTPALPAGTPVDVSLIEGTHLVATLAAAYTPVEMPVGETVDTDQDGLPDAWEFLFGLDPSDPADAARDPDGDGLSSLDEYQSGTHPTATWTRALAEGVSSATFATDLSLFNPGVARATVATGVTSWAHGGGTFLRPAPAVPIVRRVGVPARSRISLWVDTLDPDLAATDVSAIVRSVDARPIVVERAMYTQDGPILFGATGHRAGGVSQADTTWYFAEGYAGDPFDTYLLVTNFEATDADVTIEVAGDAGLVHSERHIVAPGERLTRYVGDMPVAGPVGFTLRSTNAVPVVAERAMWFRTKAGQPWIDSHASAGATVGATRWGLAGLAVGGTGHAVTYLLVHNIADADTTVTIALSLPDGTTSAHSYSVAAASRLTLEVGADFPGTSGTISSAIVSATTALVVEASTYWDADGTRWTAGTNVRGTPLP